MLEGLPRGSSLKLDKEKISPTGYFRIGFDMISGNYLLETDDTMGNNRYFVLTQKQYIWFDTQPDKLYELYIECVKKNNKSNLFYFSNWERENTEEQNKLMWKYTYWDLLYGKSASEVHEKMGIPDEIGEDGRSETYIISAELQIQVLYKNQKCINVK